MFQSFSRSGILALRKRDRIWLQFREVLLRILCNTMARVIIIHLIQCDRLAKKSS